MSSSWFMDQPHQIFNFQITLVVIDPFGSHIPFTYKLFTHLFRIIWLYAWATLYIFQQSMFLAAAGIKRSATTGSLKRVWLGANASKSSGSSLKEVGGLVFSVCLTTQILVFNTSNAKLLFASTGVSRGLIGSQDLYQRINLESCQKVCSRFEKN